MDDETKDPLPELLWTAEQPNYRLVGPDTLRRTIAEIERLRALERTLENHPCRSATTHGCCVEALLAATPRK